MWSIAKSLQIPIDSRVKNISDIPYTISYVIRKRLQIDNLNELPKEKRPPENIIWDGTSKDLDDWIERVVSKKEEPTLTFNINEVEG